jgi:hypothetical protein
VQTEKHLPNGAKKRNKKMSFDLDNLPKREEIQTQTDLVTLNEWHEEAIDLLDTLKAQLAAYNLLDQHDDEDYEWAIRVKGKAGYAGTALRRIERRMVQLDAPLPLTVDRKERELINHLNGIVGFLQRLCEKNDIEHGTAKRENK